jgi:hypothetical protein
MHLGLVVMACTAVVSATLILTGKLTLDKKPV